MWLKNLIGQNQSDVLLEKIVENHQQLAKNNELIIVEGLVSTRKHGYANSINYEIAKALDAEIVLVAVPATETPAPELKKERIEAAASQFGGKNNPNLLGVIINKFNAPIDESSSYSSRPRNVKFLMLTNINKITPMKFTSYLKKALLKY